MTHQQHIEILNNLYNDCCIKVHTEDSERLNVLLKRNIDQLFYSVSDIIEHNKEGIGQ